MGPILQQKGSPLQASPLFSSLVLPTERETGAQHEVVLELAAAIKIAAIEIVFRFQSQTHGRRERNPDAEAEHATPVRGAGVIPRHVMAAANDRRTAAQEDADAGILGGEAKQQLRATDKHLRIATAINRGTGARHSDTRWSEPSRELEANWAPSPRGESRACDEAIVAANIATDSAERIPGRDVRARPGCKGEAALRGRGSCAQRADDTD